MQNQLNSNKESDYDIVIFCSFPTAEIPGTFSETVRFVQ